MTEGSTAAFEAFIADMRALYQEDLPPERHWRRTAELLEVLVRDEPFLALTDDWPEGDGKQYVLYQDPDHGFVIDGLVRKPFHEAVVHDHAHTWTAYGIVVGEETMTRYLRRDDGSDPARADIEQVSCDDCPAGSVDVVPPWEIHTESNGDGRAVSLAVRSETLGNFNQNIFRPDGTVTTFRGLHRIPFPIV